MLPPEPVVSDNSDSSGKTDNLVNGPDAATAELLQSAYRYAMSLSANSADAEDLVQEGWLRARERYGANADRKIVFRIVRNLYIDGWRRAARFPTVDFDTTSTANMQLKDGDASRDPERSCGDGALGRHLAQLRDEEREALLLSVVEGYSAGEIASLIGKPRGTVLSLVHRAKQKIQLAMNGEERDAKLKRSGSLSLVEPRNNERLKR